MKSHYTVSGREEVWLTHFLKDHSDCSAETTWNQGWVGRQRAGIRVKRTTVAIRPQRYHRMLIRRGEVLTVWMQIQKDAWSDGKIHHVEERERGSQRWLLLGLSFSPELLIPWGVATLLALQRIQIFFFLVVCGGGWLQSSLKKKKNCPTTWKHTRAFLWKSYIDGLTSQYRFVSTWNPVLS